VKLTLSSPLSVIADVAEVLELESISWKLLWLTRWITLVKTQFEIAKLRILRLPSASAKNHMLGLNTTTTTYDSAAVTTCVIDELLMSTLESWTAMQALVNG